MTTRILRPVKPDWPLWRLTPDERVEVADGYLNEQVVVTVNPLRRVGEDAVRHELRGTVIAVAGATRGASYEIGYVLVVEDEEGCQQWVQLARVERIDCVAVGAVPPAQKT